MLCRLRDYELVDIDATEEYRAPTVALKKGLRYLRARISVFRAWLQTSKAYNKKNGDPMAIVTLEDMEGELSLVLFPKAYKKYASTLAEVLTRKPENAGRCYRGCFRQA